MDDIPTDDSYASSKPECNFWSTQPGGNFPYRNASPLQYALANILMLGIGGDKPDSLIGISLGTTEADKKLCKFFNEKNNIPYSPEMGNEHYLFQNGADQGIAFSEAALDYTGTSGFPVDFNGKTQGCLSSDEGPFQGYTIYQVLEEH